MIIHTTTLIYTAAVCEMRQQWKSAAYYWGLVAERLPYRQADLVEKRQGECLQKAGMK